MSMPSPSFSIDISPVVLSVHTLIYDTGRNLRASVFVSSAVFNAVAFF